MDMEMGEDEERGLVVVGNKKRSGWFQDERQRKSCYQWIYREHSKSELEVKIEAHRNGFDKGYREYLYRE